MCSRCHEHGAMVGCLHKGCQMKYHHFCAMEEGINSSLSFMNGCPTIISSLHLLLSAQLLRSMEFYKESYFVWFTFGKEVCSERKECASEEQMSCEFCPLKVDPGLQGRKINLEELMPLQVYSFTLIHVEPGSVASKQTNILCAF